MQLHNACACHLLTQEFPFRSRSLFVLLTPYLFWRILHVLMQVAAAVVAVVVVIVVAVAVLPLPLLLLLVLVLLPMFALI